MQFFETPRVRFFRILAGKYRAVVAAVLVELHERLFGPTSEPAVLLPDEVRALVALWIPRMPTVESDEVPGQQESIIAGGERERDELAGALVRQLIEDGWLERYFSDLRSALRFTRAGKVFAGALSEVAQPRRKTRLRNMRSVRNALKQFYERGEADDLSDALHYASAMSDELTEDIHALQDRGRDLLQRREHAGDHLAELNRRMDGDYAPRLLADNVDTYSGDIILELDHLRSLPDDRRAHLNARVSIDLPWLVDEAPVGVRPLDYALNRVHEIVVNVCLPKQSAMVHEILSVTRLMAQIVGHQCFVHAGAASSSVTRLVGTLNAATASERERLLAIFAAAIAPVGCRWLNPTRVSLGAKRSIAPVDLSLENPVVDRETRRQEAIAQAVDAAFSTDSAANGSRLAARLRADTALYFSELPANDALDVLHAIFAVSDVNDVLPVSVHRLHTRRVVTELFDTVDLLIRPAPTTGP